MPNLGLFKVSVLAGVVGVLGGVTAELLHQLIGLVTHLAFYQRTDTHIVSPLDSELGIFMIFVPAMGGLIIGVLARYGSPLVRGHGIPEAMEAVLLKRSRIHPKVALLKPISAAITIGSGQPFGAEGPIIQTGAALGSLLGQALHTTSAERKVLLACGAAAGLAATFGTPIAAVILAIELLLFEFRTRSFIPLAIASTVATGVHITFLGSEPIFAIETTDFGRPLNLVFFVVLGLICGLVAIALTRLLYVAEDQFHRLPINTYLWPALGGLFVGVVGYSVPRLTYHEVDVFGPGYYVIENILNGQYVIELLLVLFLAKGAVWLVTLGSGTSGGTLAPIFMIGAAIGGIFGLLVKQAFPQVDTTPTAFAMAGMAAVFGSSTRATFASIIFAFEITQSYESILPVMLASVVADAVMASMMQTTILTEQLRRKGVLVEQEYEADILATVTVASVMDTDPVIIPHTTSVHELIDSLNRHDKTLTRHQAILIVNDSGLLCGIITRNDLLDALQEQNPGTTVLDVASSRLIVAYPDETVREALNRMLEVGVGRLPVMSRQNPRQVVGYLSRANVLEANRKRLHEEVVVDVGWISFHESSN